MNPKKPYQQPMKQTLKTLSTILKTNQTNPKNPIKNPKHLSDKHQIPSQNP